MWAAPAVVLHRRAPSQAIAQIARAASASNCRRPSELNPASLDHLEVAFEEESLLRKGLAALDVVYTEIDLAAIALSRPVPS